MPCGCGLTRTSMSCITTHKARSSETGETGGKSATREGSKFWVRISENLELRTSNLELRTLSPSRLSRASLRLSTYNTRDNGVRHSGKSGGRSFISRLYSGPGPGSCGRCSRCLRGWPLRFRPHAGGEIMEDVPSEKVPAAPERRVPCHTRKKMHRGTRRSR